MKFASFLLLLLLSTANAFLFKSTWSRHRIPTPLKMTQVLLPTQDKPVLVDQQVYIQNPPKIMLELTDSDFEKNINNGNLSVCFFTSQSCAPCQDMQETLLSTVMGAVPSDNINFYFSNTDVSIEVPATYQIRSIPSILLFKNGKVVSEVIGAVPAHVILGQIMKHNSENLQ